MSKLKTFEERILAWDERPRGATMTRFGLCLLCLWPWYWTATSIDVLAPWPRLHAVMGILSGAEIGLVAGIVWWLLAWARRFLFRKWSGGWLTLVMVACAPWIVFSIVGTLGHAFRDWLAGTLAHAQGSTASFWRVIPNDIGWHLLTAWSVGVSLWEAALGMLGHLRRSQALQTSALRANLAPHFLLTP